MDQSLRALCDALKKIIGQLKQHHQPLSFLLLTGKTQQGKTTLLRQSHYEHLRVETARSADIFYNKNSLILELGEAWLNQSQNILQYTLKQINNCHRTIKISGIILCIDINELFIDEPTQLTLTSKAHAQFLERFGLSLGYRVDLSVMFTKMDVLAGFCDFFQQDHPSELNKPLGFSLQGNTQTIKLADAYKIQFDHFIEVLGQRVIDKIHPVRSSIKRTLIREFPLQLSCLRPAIQSFIQHVSTHLFCLDALYFTSAEQGGISQDRLNKKIKHEYGLSLQVEFPQSTNYKAYFIEGALQAFHEKTKQHIPQIDATSQRWFMNALMGVAGLSFIWIGHHYLNSSHKLDETSNELFNYNMLASQQDKNTEAMYHLMRASLSIEDIASNSLSSPVIQALKTQLSLDTQQQVNDFFIHELLNELETTIDDNRQPPSARYHALKIYLMLGNSRQYAPNDVEAWFNQRWGKLDPNDISKKMALLKHRLQQPLQPMPINTKIISDARNYLNALPTNYLYYALAKESFSQQTQSLNIEGFILANNQVPTYLTKTDFHHVIASLPKISAKLQAENWIMERQDLSHLEQTLQQAYCHEYVAWWQNFMRHSSPMHAENYQKARELAQALSNSQAIAKLVNLIQDQLSPESGDTLFNQEIASKFTELSLISHSTIHNLTITLKELERFLTSLSIVNDDGKTAFTITKARFQGDTLNNPLSSLYGYGLQLPEPVSTWAKQIADDTWFNLISDSKRYINQQWKQTVLQDYQDTIAKRYPFDASATQDIAISDFDRFFANRGVLNHFIENYIKPFLDVSQPQWTLKDVNHYVLPISSDVLNELIRANIVTNMFFPDQSSTSKIEFSLQKINLDPVVNSLSLSIGEHSLKDNQNSDSFAHFFWPQSNARLSLNSIEGDHFEIEESGPWAFFKILQKVNVLVDEQDPASLQILFEINGNSGRYLLKTHNEVNPFMPGVLSGFALPERIV